ncbi:MAG: AAA family ATPase, partial [Acidimicrobiales bacterium]
HWAALARQADRYTRNLRPWTRGRAAQRIASDLAAYRAEVVALRDEAEGALDAAGDGARRRAERQLGLRLALIGKGGAGKTAISATLARVLARQGRQVLAADLDTNPGAVFTLGLGLTEATLPEEATAEHEGAAYGWNLASELSPRDVVERFTLPAPDGVRYIGVGKIGDPEKQEAKRTLVALLQVLIGFGDPDWDVIGDLEAGPTTPFERYHSFADDVFVVVGPAWRSALTARRLRPMVDDVALSVVANRFRDEPDHPGLEPRFRVPYCPELAEAERLGLAPLDYCPDSPAVRAIEEMARLIIAEEVPV